MKKFKTKRITAMVSLVLVFSMLFSLNASVFAEENQNEKQNPILKPNKQEFSKESREKTDEESTYAPFAYTTTASEVESNNTMGTANSISLATRRNAVISSATDVDWYVFTPTSTGRYRFDMSDIPTPTTVNYDMVLYNATNTVVGKSTFAGSIYETIFASLAANTKYYLRVYSYKGTSTAKYNVTVTNDACALLNWSYPFRAIVPPKNISSPYGDRDLYGILDHHLGADFDYCNGVSIYSATSGTIRAIGANLSSGRGYYVSVKVSSSEAPSSTTLVTYEHLRDKPTFAIKSDVYKSKLIGNVGGTGNGSQTGYSPHLHFQVNTNDDINNSTYANTLNPLRFYSNINFTGDTDYNEYNFASEISTSVTLLEQAPSSYYMLDSDLIQYVGQKEFENWFSSVDDENCNVPAFLKYFNISDKKYNEILTKKGLNKYYGVEKMFTFRDDLAQNNN